MPRKIKIAAAQMDARPAPAEERLQRAEALVTEAAGSGAQLVVLPEVFNTGYEYHEANYQRAERMDGPTVSWMKRVAAAHDIHLVGTLLLLDEEDIYNAMLLVAPDGRHWRYDKNYPWYWERAYFREGHAITVADTALGKLGMMICWDVTHPELWARYAGKVDAMVVCSCPPLVHELTIAFPDGQRLAAVDTGPLMKYASQNAEKTFGEYARRQTAHLNVPMVNTTGTGTFSTAVPAPHLSLATYISACPDLWPLLEQADELRVETGYFNETFVTDARGDILGHVPEGEAYTLAEVELADLPPHPRGRQPRFGLPVISYMLIDWIGTALMVPIYRRNMRRVYGSQMSPVSVQTKFWFGLVALIGFVAYMLGRAGRK